MYNLKNAVRVAAIVTLGVVAVGALPAGQAYGAPLFDEPVQRAPLALPQVDLEADYPAVVLPSVVPTPDTSIRASSASLTDLVRQLGAPTAGDEQMRCLATAVYFESKGEPLAGQLAVARVILNRSQSGKFASTLCGVVKQPSQFSFVRGGSLPPVGDSAQWRSAVGVAHVAMRDLYKSPAPTALYFHARRVSPNWGKRQVAAIGNHIFYR
jgi:N-acetylmuramoyl-L-alanine amidase